MELDVAVIGAGVAGAYCAWRLQQTYGAGAKIGLFEYSDRIGGRLYSVTLPGLPHVKAEVGGMRYIPTSHIMVASLVDLLNLPIKPFPMGAPGKVGANCNLFYLRGRHLRLHELSDPAKVPYNLTFAERGMGPTNLQVRMMNNIFPGMENLSLCDLMRVHAYGKPLWRWGFWNLAARALSNEGYQFMKDAGGYEANVANASAVTQLPATEYSDSTQFLTLRDGYDQLPLTLTQQFDAAEEGGLPANSRIFMNHRLAKIEYADGPYRYRLIFCPTVTVNGKTTPGEKNPIVVHAKKIILGLPRRSLELIDSAFFEDDWLKRNMRSVLIQAAFKLFLAYETPWWRALGLTAGRSVTDLPIRQTFYFGTEAEQPHGLPFMNSLLMASYNDIGTVPFWKGLEKGKRYKGYRPPGFPETDLVMPVMPYEATEGMVTAANAQIAAMHAMPEIPMPYSAVYHTWNEDPYGGGWHEWKADYRLDEVMCRIRKPVADQDIFIVGEAYSYLQGWVEGALCTAESMLEDFFGLARPNWISDPNYALMPNPCPGCTDLDAPVRVSGAAATLNDATPSCLNPPEVG
jgi:flavin-dependent amine oxidoreductase